MTIRMARPTRQKDSGIWYLKCRTPTDVVRLGGKPFHEKSLRTRDADVAKARFTEEYAKLIREWEAHRNGPQAVPFGVLMEIAGDYYREIMQIPGEREPGEPGVWKAMEELHGRIEAAEQDGQAGFEKWYGCEADRLLAERGLLADTSSRSRLLAELHKVAVQWSGVYRRRAEGDYRPDPDADRFPKPSPTKAAKTPNANLTITGLFEFWAADMRRQQKSEKTIEQYRRKVQTLVDFLGHDRAEDVTKVDVTDWMHHLMDDQGLSAKTINGGYRAAVGAIYQLAVGAGRLHANPGKASPVKGVDGDNKRGFDDQEARTILKAALGETESVHRRWLPWLCAFSGARVTEMAQIRKQDLVKHNGVWCLSITGEAGSIKNKNSQRLVPLHPQVIEQGVVEFLQGRPDGPVFFEDKGERAANHAAAKIIGQDVGRWVRRDLKISDSHVWPNHGWRHRFSTKARSAGISPDSLRAIKGHAGGDQSARYGEFEIELLHREISKLPYEAA